jgi:acyl-CoA oxidase
LLASAYAFRFVGDWLNWLYTDVTQKLEAKDFSTLQEAHACTAGLKAVTTSVTAVCIEFNFSNPCAVLLVINGLYSSALFGSLIQL